MNLEQMGVAREAARICTKSKRDFIHMCWCAGVVYCTSIYLVNQGEMYEY